MPCILLFKKCTLANSLPVQRLSKDFDFAKEMLWNGRQSACFLKCGVDLS